MPGHEWPPAIPLDRNAGNERAALPIAALMLQLPSCSIGLQNERPAP
jgi:hypothetical protein